MIPNLNQVCDCCGGSESQPLLQLFDNKCFKIVDGRMLIAFGVQLFMYATPIIYPISVDVLFKKWLRFSSQVI
jgi:hypothetical protein